MIPRLISSKKRRIWLDVKRDPGSSEFSFRSSEIPPLVSPFVGFVFRWLQQHGLLHYKHSTTEQQIALSRDACSVWVHVSTFFSTLRMMLTPDSWNYWVPLISRLHLDHLMLWFPQGLTPKNDGFNWCWCNYAPATNLLDMGQNLGPPMVDRSHCKKRHSLFELSNINRNTIYWCILSTKHMHGISMIE